MTICSLARCTGKRMLITVQLLHCETSFFRYLLTVTCWLLICGLHHDWLPVGCQQIVPFTAAQLAAPIICAMLFLIDIASVTSLYILFDFWCCCCCRVHLRAVCLQPFSGNVISRVQSLQPILQLCLCAAVDNVTLLFATRTHVGCCKAPLLLTRCRVALVGPEAI